jgi:hypothetical protein
MTTASNSPDILYTSTHAHSLKSIFDIRQIQAQVDFMENKLTYLLFLFQVYQGND